MDDEKKLDRFIRKEILVEGLGILDASEDEVKRLKHTKTGASYTLSDIVSRRAQIGWSTLSATSPLKTTPFMIILANGIYSHPRAFWC